MNLTELDDELVAMLEKSINQMKVAAALERFLEHDHDRLNGPELIEYAATVLSAVVRTCPSREVAFKLFFKSLTKMVPGVGVQIAHGNVDQGAS